MEIRRHWTCTSGCVRRSLRSRGYTESAILLILAGRRPGTQRGYNLKWDKWVDWCALQQLLVDTIKPEPLDLVISLDTSPRFSALNQLLSMSTDLRLTLLSVTFADVRRLITPHGLQCGVC